ncbi:M81 family metallopeptidase [Nordella sp. HKS 07]|uniref:M81 family metallopeptidase n=1 Tax=Nordella sp. HKS 07 TaxID=2712222 RepID=UPI0013E15E79|nr:M81 family metallopeptidase [Nordella sp. HKS 07]QIG48906.1 M81 family metallopeptidase [Nordella sp. HKS 07]
MKIFIAALITETNTFSPLPTGAASFYAADTYRRRDASLDDTAAETICQKTWRRLAERDGHEIVESVTAIAQPAGTTIRPLYEELRDTILDDLRKAGPVDIVLLLMHGAMVADGYDDCEGDTAEKVRAIVGPDVPVGMELDLHCHLTDRMIDNCSVIIAFKEYPHTDMEPRAAELYDLCLKARRGEIRPVMALHDCRMINMWRTPVEPMRGFVQRMRALEGRDGILSVTFGHGFPWGDVEDVGARMLVVADGDRDKARHVAEELSREVWDMRHATGTRHDTVDEALDHALKARNGPVVLADVADNAGGGAPGDSTFILRRIIDRRIGNVVSGCYWDPQAVALCEEAGEGASFDLRIGGKCGKASGDPVDLRITVKRLLPEVLQSGLSEDWAPLGRGVWVQAADDVDLVLVTLRSQTFAPDAYSAFGIDVSRKAIVVVKSTQHFYAGFAPIASEIRYVTTPGAIPPDYAAIAYTKRRLPFWPRVENPFT